MSDFHEMATHFRMQEERSLLLENHACMFAKNVRSSGIGSSPTLSILQKKMSTLISISFLKEKPIINLALESQVNFSDVLKFAPSSFTIAF